jgi:hypothetical protein
MWCACKAPWGCCLAGIAVVGTGAATHGKTETEKGMDLLQRKNREQGEEQYATGSGHFAIPVWMVSAKYGRFRGIFRPVLKFSRIAPR